MVVLQLLVILGLGEEERGVQPLLSHQIIMRSLFYDLASIYHENPVGHFHRGQPMTD